MQKKKDNLRRLDLVTAIAPQPAAVVEFRGGRRDTSDAVAADGSAVADDGGDSDDKPPKYPRFYSRAGKMCDQSIRVDFDDPTEKAKTTQAYETTDVDNLDTVNACAKVIAMMTAGSKEYDADVMAAAKKSSKQGKKGEEKLLKAAADAVGPQLTWATKGGSVHTEQGVAVDVQRVVVKPTGSLFPNTKIEGSRAVDYSAQMARKPLLSGQIRPQSRPSMSPSLSVASSAGFTIRTPLRLEVDLAESHGGDLGPVSIQSKASQASQASKESEEATGYEGGERALVLHPRGTGGNNNYASSTNGAAPGGGIDSGSGSGASNGIGHGKKKKSIIILAEDLHFDIHDSEPGSFASMRRSSDNFGGGQRYRNKSQQLAMLSQKLSHSFAKFGSSPLFRAKRKVGGHDTGEELLTGSLDDEGEIVGRGRGMGMGMEQLDEELEEDEDLSDVDSDSDNDSDGDSYSEDSGSGDSGSIDGEILRQESAARQQEGQELMEEIFSKFKSTQIIVAN